MFFFDVSSNIIFDHVICFDLYCGKHAYYKEIPLLLVTNDHWFSFDYMKYLMLLYAQFVACQFKQPILYISHSRGYWINKHGFIKLCSH